MTNDYYRLHPQTHVAIPCKDVLEWAEFYENTESRRVARDEIVPGITVSTVFLGIDHNYGDGDPILFESMVFGGPWDQEMWRYCLWAEAELAHKTIVATMRDRKWIVPRRWHEKRNYTQRVYKKWAKRAARANSNMLELGTPEI